MVRFCAGLTRIAWTRAQIDQLLLPERSDHKSLHCDKAPSVTLGRGSRVPGCVYPPREFCRIHPTSGEQAEFERHLEAGP